jgi:protein-S-isoprenylcysteine O-methyltransferase Ste14
MVLKWVFFTIYLIGILSALWSVLKVFKADATTDRKQYLILRLVSVAYWVLSLYFTVTHESSQIQYSLGIFMSTSGVIIFWWAQRSILKKGLALIYSKTAPVAIATQGPYNYVRHPFYTSYILIYASALISTSTWIQGALFLALISLYVFAARTEERMLLSGIHAATYQEYYNQRGRFFPRLRSSTSKTKPPKAS